MRQRVTIALATVCRPEFIIADEPTTALDVVVQKGVLAMIREVQRELGSSLLFVTHDLAVHANLTDRLGIMYAGRLVEEGPTADVFREPAASLHRAPDRQPAADRRRRAQEGPRGRAAEPRRSAAGLPLPSALPARHATSAASESPPLVADRAGPPRRLLRRRPPGRRRHEQRRCSRSTTSPRPMRWAASCRGSDFDAVAEVSFALAAGRPEIFTVVGESGSGKTTLARMILNLVPPTRGCGALSRHRPSRRSAAAASASPSCARSSRSSRTRSAPSTR